MNTATTININPIRVDEFCNASWHDSTVPLEHKPPLALQETAVGAMLEGSCHTHVSVKHVLVL